jgi:hypothetical protein
LAASLGAGGVGELLRRLKPGPGTGAAVAVRPRRNVARV